MDLLVLLALGGVGVLAGFVDAIAGGGGLIALPALLSAGLPPIAAFATNKVQSVVGTAMAAGTYWRGGFISLPRLLPAMLATFAGSWLGALAVKSIDVTILNYAVPVSLIVIAGYFMFAPRLSDADRHARLDFARFVPLMGFTIGFYDGIFGPGTGMFLIMTFTALLSQNFLMSAAMAKVEVTSG